MANEKRKENLAKRIATLDKRLVKAQTNNDAESIERISARKVKMTERLNKL